MKLLAAFSGFSINDQEKAKDFYTRIIGLDLVDENMGLRFRLPYGGMLFLYEKPNHEAATYTILNLIVEDIDDAVDELVGKGVEFEIYDNVMPGAPKQDKKGVLRSPDPEKYGPSIAWFKDPAGNILALLEEVKPPEKET